MHKAEPKIEQVGGIGFVSVIDTQKAETIPGTQSRRRSPPVQPGRDRHPGRGRPGSPRSGALLASTPRRSSDQSALVARWTSAPTRSVRPSPPTTPGRGRLLDLDQNPDGKQGIAIVDTKVADGSDKAYTGMVVTAACRVSSRGATH
jgi:hypothetical protein